MIGIALGPEVTVDETPDHPDQDQVGDDGQGSGDAETWLNHAGGQGGQGSDPLFGQVDEEDRREDDVDEDETEYWAERAREAQA